MAGSKAVTPAQYLKELDPERRKEHLSRYVQWQAAILHWLGFPETSLRTLHDVRLYG